MGVIPVGSASHLDLGNPPKCADILSIDRTSQLDPLSTNPLISPQPLVQDARSGYSIHISNRIGNSFHGILPVAIEEHSAELRRLAEWDRLRLGFGQPRDWILGIEIATVDGRSSEAAAVS